VSDCHLLIFIQIWSNQGLQHTRKAEMCEVYEAETCSSIFTPATSLLARRFCVDHPSQCYKILILGKLRHESTSAWCQGRVARQMGETNEPSKRRMSAFFRLSFFDPHGKAGPLMACKGSPLCGRTFQHDIRLTHVPISICEAQLTIQQ